MTRKVIGAHEALQEANKVLDKHIAGCKDEPVPEAAMKLQQAFMKPWLAWVGENIDNPETMVEAFCLVMGAYFAEVIRNTANPEDHKEAVIFMGKATTEIAHGMLNMKTTPGIAIERKSLKIMDKQ